MKNLKRLLRYFSATELRALWKLLHWYPTSTLMYVKDLEERLRKHEQYSSLGMSFSGECDDCKQCFRQSSLPELRFQNGKAYQCCAQCAQDFTEQQARSQRTDLRSPDSLFAILQQGVFYQ